MEETVIIKKLAANKGVFEHLFSHVSPKEILWRPYPEHWCILEILCHLHDNEHEDFMIRVKSVLDNPARPFKSIEPGQWVKERAYLEQDFNEKLDSFLRKRVESIQWLERLETPTWDNTYHHETFGKLTARNLLTNWLAHDNLHIRQITRIKYLYLKEKSGENLNYAGNW